MRILFDGASLFVGGDPERVAQFKEQYKRAMNGGGDAIIHGDGLTFRFRRERTAQEATLQQLLELPDDTTLETCKSVFVHRKHERDEQHSAVCAERDQLKRDRDALAVQLENMKAERDQLKAERDALKPSKE